MQNCVSYILRNEGHTQFEFKPILFYRYLIEVKTHIRLKLKNIYAIQTLRGLMFKRLIHYQSKGIQNVIFQ